jgi:signal transduction histidine kinase
VTTAALPAVPIHRGSSAPWALRLALAQLGAMALTLTGVEIAMFVWGSAEPIWAVVLFPLTGAAYVLAGLLAWYRRPSNRTGALLGLGGLSVLAAALVNADVPALVAVGLISQTVMLAVMLHTLLAFPSGRLVGLLPRTLVAAGYATALVLQVPQYLFAAAPSPYDVLSIAARDDLVQTAESAQDVAGSVVIALTSFVLARRLRGATPAQRRVLAALYSFGIAAILFVSVSANVLPPLFGFGPVTVFVLQISAIAAIPLAFVSGVLFGGFARTGEIEELGAWLGTSDGRRPELRAALADTLGDESIQLIFWMSDRGAFVTADGRPVELPAPGSGRAAVKIDLADRRIGAIVYDATLIADPELVRAAGRVVALALDRDRLTAELLASWEALRDSRGRLVEAADSERRRIARDLHDGLQGRLVLLALKAARIARDPAASGPLSRDVAEVHSGLDAATDELQRLVHGVMPALLIERGLHAATEELVDRMPLPTVLDAHDVDAALPAAVESVGFFVVAEALANAVKHSCATRLSVRLGRVNENLEIEVGDDGIGGATVGSDAGLRGIADRVDALGGRLVVESPPGGGTRLLAEVPCAS